MPSCSSARATADAIRSCKLRKACKACNGWVAAALVVLLVPAMQPALAALGEADAHGPRWEVESLPHAIQPRTAVTGARPLFDTPSDGLRTRMWWGNRAFEVGGGANLNPSNTAPGLATSANVGTAVLGLRAQLAQGTHLAIERDTLATSVGSGAAAPLEVSRVALEFKAVGRSKTAQPLSSGLLRVQMSGTSSLQFKPRSGGLAVTYRAKF